MNPIQKSYQQKLTNKGFTADATQLKAIELLEQCHEQLLNFIATKNGFLNTAKTMVTSWFSTSKIDNTIKGIYLWGGVGRGKSFLMDSFLEASEVPLDKKTRLHFHEFMRSIHTELNRSDIKKQKDPLQLVAKKVATQYDLICFDEFHVSDIADAMILHRLLQFFSEYGLILIMTSNYPPEKLYPDGLHRERFLPAIATILEQNTIFNVDSGIDYRRRTLTKIPIYHVIDNKQSDTNIDKINFLLNQAFDELNPTETEHIPAIINIENRQIIAKRYAESVIWFDFKILCGGPRSQNDYIELAQQFQTIILSDIPKLSAGDASSARRFTWFIDVCYDFSVKVIFSADVIPENIYTQGQLANEFHRTVSRITEMQSAEYLALEKRSQKTL